MKNKLCQHARKHVSILHHYVYIQDNYASQMHFEMQHHYGNMRLIDVDMLLIYVSMQVNYVNIQNSSFL